MSTSTDSTPVSLPFTLTPATAVGDRTVSLSSMSANASQMTYTTKSRTTNGLTANISTVTLTASPGTIFPPAGCDYSIADPRTH